MKFRPIFAAVSLIVLTSIAGSARADTPKWVRGGFEMTGFLSAGLGWQHFSNQAVTNNQGSAFGGPIGAMIPNAQTGVAPNPGEDFVEGYFQRAEIDVIKHFGKRAVVRADLYFGRANSGSTVGGFALEHAYAAVRLGKGYNWEIQIGRIGLVTGVESYEFYYNDTISTSILSRASLYPGPITGVLVTGDISDNLNLYFGIGNNLTFDTTARVSDIPGAVGIVEIDWGPEGLGNYTAITLWVGPETNGNRHLTFGANVDLTWYFTKRWQLGFEGLYKGFRGRPGPTVNYAAGLVWLHWVLNEQWTPYVKYAYGNQFEPGAGVFNLTGAKQQIHEMSVGFVYHIADGFKFKVEGRGDLTLPAGARRQLVYGMATGFDCAF